MVSDRAFSWVVGGITIGVTLMLQLLFKGLEYLDDPTLVLPTYLFSVHVLALECLQSSLFSRGGLSLTMRQVSERQCIDGDCGF